VKRLRKDQTEALLHALDSATSGPLEEITVARERLCVALRLVLESDGDWPDLIDGAAQRAEWSEERRLLLRRAEHPEHDADPEETLWALWELVTELNERRTLG
jgi:hypothetical protein